MDFDRSPDNAIFPDFEPRRLGASGFADGRIWSADFRERVSGRISSRKKRMLTKRRESAADSFDLLGTALRRIYDSN